MSLHKVMCCCVSGLGSSFIMEMNLNKALKKLGITGVQVEHSGINDAMRGAADLFICSSDVAEECRKAGDTIALDVLTDPREIESKLKQYLESKGLK